MRFDHLDKRPTSLAAKVSLVLLALAALSSPARAQETPLISGGAAFYSSTNAGFTFFQPILAPVAAVPLGPHLLVESRADLRGVYQQKNRTGPFHGSFTAQLEYLQLDYIAHPRLTITAGRFLTPFGTYNERLTPVWIRNFQDTPLIYGVGTRSTGSSDGIMLRSAVFSNDRVHVDALGYFSVSNSSTQLGAARTAGERVDVFFPSTRLEIGSSYNRFLERTHNNSFGAHLWWQPPSSPVQIRSEYAHGPHAQGYWIETAYRLSRWGGPTSALGRLEPLFRMQQSFRNSPGPGDALPSADTQQADFGLDYHFPQEIRLNTSYSRFFSSSGNGNIWDISLSYRFLFPVWRGHQ